MRIWPYILIIIVIVLIGVGARYYVGTKEVLCDQMARFCPDGSAQQRLNDGTCDLAPCGWTPCDAQIPCSAGMTCVSVVNPQRFADGLPKTPICVIEGTVERANLPCNRFCTGECQIRESYPPQIVCAPQP